MDIKDIETLLKLAKKHKLQRFEANGVSFEFKHPSSRKHVSRETQGEVPIHGEQMPSDDEMLFYSADSPIQVPS
jgi:hypothetical protein